MPEATEFHKYHFPLMSETSFAFKETRKRSVPAASVAASRS